MPFKKSVARLRKISGFIRQRYYAASHPVLARRAKKEMARIIFNATRYPQREFLLLPKREQNIAKLCYMYAQEISKDSAEMHPESVVIRKVKLARAKITQIEKVRNLASVETCWDFLIKSRESANLFIDENITDPGSIWLTANLGARELGGIKTEFAKENGRKILYIDVIQGSKSDLHGEEMIKANETFAKEFGTPWSRFLVKNAVETAGNAGFSEARLIRPEKIPRWYERHGNETEQEAKERQERMRKLYYTVAGKEHFDIVSGRTYRIKKL
jgi:hypothetical protein